MSKERALKNWRKRLDEYDGDDDEVAINYRQYAMLLRQGDLADMLHADGMINCLLADVLHQAPPQVGDNVNGWINEMIEYCLGKHEWWDEFTKWCLGEIELEELNDEELTDAG